MIRFAVRTPLLVLVATLAVGSSSPAADPHASIPGDAKVVVQLNVRQLLEAPLTDGDKPATLKAILDEKYKDVQLLDVIPFKQITTAVVALPTLGETKKIFAVLHGKFDPPGLRKEVARRFKDSVKEHGAGATAFQEFRIPVEKFQGIATPDEACLAVLDETTCLISLGSKADMVNALAGKNAGTPAVLRALLAKNDKEAEVSYALVNELGGPFANWKDIRRAFELFQSVHGSVRLSEEPTGRFVITCAKPEAAQELGELVQKGLNALTGVMALLSRANRDLTPTVDVLKTIRVRTDGNTIGVRGKLERDTLEDLLRRPK
jgi:hypothetical protein